MDCPQLCRVEPRRVGARLPRRGLLLSPQSAGAPLAGDGWLKDARAGGGLAASCVVNLGPDQKVTDAHSSHREYSAGVCVCVFGFERTLSLVQRIERKASIWSLIAC